MAGCLVEPLNLLSWCPWGKACGWGAGYPLPDAWWGVGLRYPALIRPAGSLGGSLLDLGAGFERQNVRPYADGFPQSKAAG